MTGLQAVPVCMNLFVSVPVMAGVSQLSTRDVTATSATVFWTRPAVAYDSYHLTFSSQVHALMGRWEELAS